MNLTIERAALLAALNSVRNVVEARNTIPILSNVLLRVADGALTVSATDLDMEATATVQTSDMASTPGEITAPATTLFEIVRKLPLGAEVNLTYDGKDPRLLVKAGRSKFQLPVLPAGGFPVLSYGEMGKSIEMDAKALVKLLDLTMFAMSSGETRYYLQGVYFHGVDVDGVDHVRLVTTDGHRLALAEAPAAGFVGLFPGVIIPRKTVREVRRMLEEADVVDVQVTAQKVRFSTAKATLASKVIDGAFPDYMRVIPKSNEKLITFDPAVLHSAVDRVATISGEKSRSTRFTFGDGVVAIRVRNMEAGEGNEEIEVEYDGESVEIGFNARYVLDVLSRIKGETAVIEVGGPASPARVLDTANPGVQFVLMPLRV